MKTICTLRGQKGKNRLPEPKNGIWGPKSVWSCDISIDREFYMEQQKTYFQGSKRKKISLQKRNLGPKISMVEWNIHRSGILHGTKLNIHLEVKKGENKSSEPKNGIWGQKSVSSCDISIVREFNMEQGKRYFWGFKRRIKPSEPKKEIGDLKSVWSCDISIIQEFYIEQQKIYIQTSKSKK
jgi:hypothetical protein